MNVGTDYIIPFWDSDLPLLLPFCTPPPTHTHLNVYTTSEKKTVLTLDHIHLFYIYYIRPTGKLSSLSCHSFFLLHEAFPSTGVRTQVSIWIKKRHVIYRLNICRMVICCWCTCVCKQIITYSEPGSSLKPLWTAATPWHSSGGSWPPPSADRPSNAPGPPSQSPGQLCWEGKTVTR